MEVSALSPLLSRESTVQTPSANGARGVFASPTNLVHFTINVKCGW